MLIQELLLVHFPHLRANDTVSFAIKQFTEAKTHALPVIQDNLFEGLLLEADVLDAEETQTISDLHKLLVNVQVKPTDYFAQALRLMADRHLDLLPAVGENKEWMGVVTYKELLPAVTRYLGINEPGAIIVLEMEPSKYALGELSRLVETNNAYITELNTYNDVASGLLIVTIKINKYEISDVLATLQRYEYQIRYYFGEEIYKNELRDNYEHLITYLNI